MDPNSNINPNPAPEAPAPAPAPENPAPAPATAPAAPATNPAPVVPSAKPVAGKKPLPKKFILIGIIALVAIIAVVLGFIFIPKLFKSDEAKLAEEIFSEDALIAVKQDDKYGYIDLNGKTVINPQFASASDFVGNKAIVRIKDCDTSHEAIIDRTGKVLLKSTTRDGISYDQENEIWEVDKKLYDKNLKQITPEGMEVYSEKEGYYYVAGSDYLESTDRQIYNKKGKVVYKFTSTHLYWDVTEYSDELEQAYASIETGDDTYAIINLDSGKVIADNLKSDNIWAEDYTDFCVYDGEDCVKYILVWNDKIVKEYDYEVELYHYGDGKNGYYLIRDDSYNSSNKHDDEYLNLKNSEITSTIPSSSSDTDSSNLSAWEIASKSTIFSCSNGYGLMVDKTQAIPCEYKHLRAPDTISYEYFKSKGKDYVIGNKSEKSYLLQTKNGKVVKEFDNAYVDFETLSSFVYYEKDDDNYYVYNIITGKSAEIKGSYIYAEPMYVMVRNDDKVEYYNKNFKLFYTGER